MPAKPPSRTSALLEAMKRPPAPLPVQQAPVLEAFPTSAETSEAKQAPKPPVPVDPPVSGRRANYKLVYFTDDDRSVLSEKMVWVASQGIRPSDSLIVRAALRVAKPDQAFREALEAILRNDKRTRKARARAGR